MTKIKQKRNWKEKIVDPKNIQELIQFYRSQSKTIATSNGSYDLLHAGHLHILFEASQKADILVVALNSDKSIKKYKCITRPIISLKHRLQMIAALEFVDHVTWFDEENPITILKKIKPDVHTIGSEYENRCIEADILNQWGSKLHFIDRIFSLSTSKIIERIKNAINKNI